MARYSTSWTSLTMTAVGDSTAMGANNYCAIGNISTAAASTTIRVSEVYIGGEAASASTPATIVVARHSTNANGPSNLGAGIRQTLTDAGSAGVPTTSLPNSFSSATTANPSRSSSAHLLHLSFNAYGGIVRWVASPDQMISLVGTAVPLSEMSISAITAATAPVTSGHFLYEVA